MGIDSLEKKNRAKRYLRQEMGTVRGKMALVDLSGTGKTTESIIALLGDDFHEKLSAFYMLDLAREVSVSFHKMVFSSDNQNIDEVILELFTRAPHGLTVDYGIGQSGNLEPVLETSEGELLKSWGYDDYIDGVLAFSRSYARFCSRYRVDTSSDLFLGIYRGLLQSPDRKTLRLLSSIPFADYSDGTNHRQRQFAPPFLLPLVILDCLTHKKATKTEFPVYSLLRGDPLVRLLDKVLRMSGRSFNLLYKLLISKLFTA